MRSHSLAATLALPLVVSFYGPKEPAAPQALDSSALQEETPAKAKTVEVRLETVSCHIVDESNTALVTTRNGMVRRVDLETLEATAETRDHLGARVRVHKVNGGRIVTSDSHGLAVLRNGVSLQPLYHGSVGSKSRLVTVDPGGEFVAAAAGDTKVVLARLTNPKAEKSEWSSEGKVLDLAISPTGASLVCLQEFGFQSIQGGEISSLLPLPAEYVPTHVEFINDELMAVGANGHQMEDPVAVLFVNPKNGELKGTVEAPFHSAPLGGFVSTLNYDEESGLLTFGISSAGSVVQVDPTDFSVRWDIIFGGGNPGGIGVHRSKGAKRCFSGGMTNSHRAAFDWESGQLLSGNELHGYTYLCGSSDDQFTLGVRHGRLIRLNSDGYHAEWQRTEYAAPLSGGRAVFSQPR